jgi:hypothetical protein
MLRTVLLVSMLVVCFAPTALADEVCVTDACVPLPLPPHCHIYDACGAHECDSCEGAQRGE